MTRVPSATSVRVGSSPVLSLVMPAAVGLVMLGMLFAVPPDQRHVDTDHFLLVTAGVVAGVAVLVGYSWRRAGGDRVVADEVGLAVRSRRHGDRVLRWDQVLELGWVVPSQNRAGGLAGRLREGGPYDVPGPAIAGWLCQPLGVLRPRSLAALQALAEQHDVAWRDYTGAEVM